jgi:hypothetical protein
MKKETFEEYSSEILSETKHNPKLVRQLWNANTADEIAAILSKHEAGREVEIATLRARVAELEKAAEPEPTTFRGWLEKLPDGYRERALAQCYYPGNLEVSIDGAILGFASWSATEEGYSFWNEVYSHYLNGTPLPPLPEQP